MESIMEVLQVIGEFFTTDIWVFFYELMREATSWAVIAMVKIKIFFVSFAWDVASTILANLGLSSIIQNSWQAIDSISMSYFTFFRIPEAINIMLQAVITRFTISVMGIV